MFLLTLALIRATINAPERKCACRCKVDTGVDAIERLATKRGGFVRAPLATAVSRAAPHVKIPLTAKAHANG
jgi:hypothetical protein